MARHDLLILTEKGQERALLEAGIARDCFLMEKKIEYEIENGEAWCIPAIVSRQERGKGLGLEAGFSFPWFRDGQRIRLSGYVYFQEIIKVLSPYDVLRTLPQCFHGKLGVFFEELKNMSNEYGIPVGVYGSAAMELVSGLPYLHRDSDLDLIMEARPVERIEQFYCKICQAAKRLGMKTDMEIRVGQFGDVKVQELFSHQTTLLVKSGRDIFLYDRKKLENRINVLTN